MPRKEKIEERIYEIIPELPANQKKIAEYFLNNMQMLALLSIQSVAKQAGVSDESSFGSPRTQL